MGSRIAGFRPPEGFRLLLSSSLSDRKQRSSSYCLVGGPTSEKRITSEKMGTGGGEDRGEAVGWMEKAAGRRVVEYVSASWDPGRGWERMRPGGMDQGAAGRDCGEGWSGTSKAVRLTGGFFRGVLGAFYSWGAFGVQSVSSFQWPTLQGHWRSDNKSIVARVHFIGYHKQSGVGDSHQHIHLKRFSTFAGT